MKHLIFLVIFICTFHTRLSYGSGYIAPDDEYYDYIGYYSRNYGACRGQNWKQNGWPKPQLLQTVKSCQHNCDIDKNCTAFEVGAERVNVDWKEKTTCILYGHKPVRIDNNIGGYCVIKMGAETEFFENSGSSFWDSTDDGRWKISEGKWWVSNGMLIGTAIPRSCNGVYSTYNTELLTKDVEMEVDLISLKGSQDRIISVRSYDPCNEIQLNFRSLEFNDLVVQQVFNGKQTIFGTFKNASIDPQKSTHVHIKLVGNHLTVWIDNNPLPLVDSDFSFDLVYKGKVGLGVLKSKKGVDNKVGFDNVVINGVHTFN